MKEKFSERVIIILAFFSIYVIWGSTYLLNKIAVTQLPAFMLAAIRFTVSGIVIMIIAKLLGLSLKVTKKQLLNTAIAGFLFLTFGNGIVVWTLNFVDSGFVALEISAQPLVVLILMRLLQGKKIQTTSIIGVVLGVIGIYLLVSQSHIVSGENKLLSIVLIFICMCSWAYASLFVGKADLPKNYFVNTGYQMLIGGVMLCITSFTLGEKWSSPETWDTDVLYSVMALIIFGSIIAFTSFNYLLKKVSPEKVATNTYVNPIIALFLGWYFLGEVITGQSIIAAFILLLGVYFINSKREVAILSRFKIRNKE
ncbi:EamA family transporter [Urechidicola vernalis]|uniref:EamA family transporter n=1 Tax=Urechidicola vernalis TaxID=3075600 RepID=A0ABU2Y2N3_9FLAO|nr:EamA family transporter [Urechidicola sp. P050]MDT0551957.1 EamA family transporter [Urechidicola sp. P050]